jgi:tetratricopeptide (TPR) repeat protein
MMGNRLRDLFRRKRKQALLRAYQKDLQLREFFTNVENLLEYFAKQLSATDLHQRILVIHGLGGVGKSTLLIMFRFLCTDRQIPVAIASGNESVTEIQILQNFAEGLAGSGVKLRHYDKTSKRYRSIQAKVSERATELEGAVASAASALIGMVAAPFVGPTAGEATAAALEWLRGVLSTSDLELLRDPTKYLTQDFLIDLTSTSARQRLVLMLDHYERMTAVDQWVRDFTRSLPSNVLLVIAGRKPPGAAWNREWQGWAGLARIEELKEMSEENMRTLAGRYYFMRRGSDPDPSQVNQIIKFARGLPLVVTTTVDLWVQYGVEDFSRVKPQVVADLVDRILEGVPESLRPLLEAAASVRWFNKDILKAVTGKGVGDKRYNELRNFVFIRPRPEGLFMHDVIREIIDENLKTQKPSQHKAYHEAAAHYFERRGEEAIGHEKERLLLELLYHIVRIDEDAGVGLFRQLAEERSRAGLGRQIRTLLGELRSHPLVKEGNRLWVDYYAARVMHLEGRFREAEVDYESIANHAQAEDLLKAYSLCDLGNILTRWERLGQENGPDKARVILEQSRDYAALDIHLSSGLFDLTRVHEYVGGWEQATDYIREAYQFFEVNKDNLGMVYAINSLLAAHVLRGDWRGMLAAQRESLHLLSALPQYTYLKAKTLGYWSWAWPMAGRCVEAESNLRESLKFIRQVDDVVTLPTYLRNLGLSIGMQERYAEAYAHIDESLKLAEMLGTEFAENWATSMIMRGMLLIKQGDYDGAKDCLDKSWRVKKDVKDNLGISEALVCQGILSEALEVWDEAIDFYQRSLEWRWIGRRYYEAAALVGLGRVNYRLGRFDELASLITEAEVLAFRHEYYDHLSSLRLIQGSLAWDTEVERGAGQEVARVSYQEAVVCALRYNRFLLDDTLASIVTECRERGNDGQRMLSLLRDSWSSGYNEVSGSPRETISLLPEGIPLLRAEEMARQLEPGNRKRQETVLETLNKALRSN